MIRTPTLLHLMEQPVAKDMAGRVLVEAFAERRAVQWTRTYETTPLVRPAIGQTDDASEMERLRSLGYLQ